MTMLPASTVGPSLPGTEAGASSSSCRAHRLRTTGPRHSWEERTLWRTRTHGPAAVEARALHADIYLQVRVLFLPFTTVPGESTEETTGAAAAPAAQPRTFAPQRTPPATASLGDAPSHSKLFEFNSFF